MIYEINLKYKNITREIIMLYLNLCITCQKKGSTTKKGLVVRPILSSEMNLRCQVELIDIQAQPDKIFKFILVYQDHLTKFVLLRPLTHKRAKMLLAFYWTFLLHLVHLHYFIATTVENFLIRLLATYVICGLNLK